MLDAGFSLAPVGHHYLGAAPGRDAAHLPPGGETRPAAAGQAGGIHHVDEPPAHDGQRAVGPLVVGQVRRPIVRQPREQPREPASRDSKGVHRAPKVRTRQAAAMPTQAMQPIVSAITQVADLSVPIPRPCATATGQHA